MPMIAKMRLCLTASRDAVVAAGHQDAAFLYASIGDEIPDEAAERFGLVDGLLPGVSDEAAIEAARAAEEEGKARLAAAEQAQREAEAVAQAEAAAAAKAEAEAAAKAEADAAAKAEAEAAAKAEADAAAKAEADAAAKAEAEATAKEKAESKSGKKAEG